MNKKLSNTVKYVLSGALMVGLLYLAFRGVNWQNFADGLKSTNWILVACSMCCGAMAFLLRSLRWQQLLTPLDPSISFRRTFEGVNIGNLANCGLPFAGEFVRCGVVATPLATYDKILGTIALERLWDFISILLIVVLAFVLKGKMVAAFISYNIWRPIADNWGSLWWVLVLAVAAAVVAAILVYKWRKSSKICGKIWGVVAGLGAGFTSFVKMDRKLLFLLYTLLIWTMYWMMCVCVTSALPGCASIELSDTLFIMAVGNLASVIPVPGGFGAYHTLVALVLSGIYGLSWDTGILFATLSHESQAITMITFGVICYIAKSLRITRVTRVCAKK